MSGRRRGWRRGCYLYCGPAPHAKPEKLLAAILASPLSASQPEARRGRTAGGDAPGPRPRAACCSRPATRPKPRPPREARALSLPTARLRADSASSPALPQAPPLPGVPPSLRRLNIRGLYLEPRPFPESRLSFNRKVLSGVSALGSKTHPEREPGNTFTLCPTWVGLGVPLTALAECRWPRRCGHVLLVPSAPPGWQPFAGPSKSPLST